MDTVNLSSLTLNTYQDILPDNSRNRQRQLSGVKKNVQNRMIPTVGKIIDSVQLLPHHTLMLGLCSDGLPLFIDLSNPSLGSILITCEEGFGKTHQLQVLVDSALRMNLPSKIQTAVISLNPFEWGTLLSNSRGHKYSLGCFAWYDEKAKTTIENLTRLAEDRRSGKGQGSDILLILDDLAALDDLDYETQVNLRWLLEYGPQSKIWPIATLNIVAAVSMPYWVDTFRTRILGRILIKEQLVDIMLHDDVLTADLDPGEFTVKFGESWLRYRLPILGD
ncbi:MAG: hypothetical protein ABIG43_05355 [Chloroflexota bacterium]